MGATTIEWTDYSWNPITGCTPCRPGCLNCYAKRMAVRLRGRYGYPQEEPFRVTLHPDRLDEPLHWRKPRRVFVCSMGDLFHENVPREFINQVFRIIRVCQNHIFLILTKRIGRAQEYLRSIHRWPFLPNLWLGTSVSTQAEYDEAIPHLLRCPAAVRFLSLEPLLENIKLNAGIDWVIVGGESGPGARQCAIDWIRSIRNQCRAARIPLFIKQYGSFQAELYSLRDAKGANWFEWSKDMRVREWPQAARRVPG